MKAAYLSTTLAIVVAERNLIYLYPLLFVGLALAARAAPGLAPRSWPRLPSPSTSCGDAVRAAHYPNYEAHGLAIAAFANRIRRGPPTRSRLC